MGILMLVTKNPLVHKIAIIGMWVVAVGGMIGMVVHVSVNIEEVFESGQKMAFGQLLHEAIGGRFPLLAWYIDNWRSYDSRRGVCQECFDRKELILLV